MNSLNIYMADGTYEGPIIMSSTASKFTAVRVKKMDVAMYANELDMPGIYLLLVGNDSVYVGQSGLDTVKKRIQNTHSGNIDSSWHTVLGFMCVDKTISSNELLFMENAMCEYVHGKYPKCLTTSPSKANCNAKYRQEHYHLMSNQIHACNHYLGDIQYYISLFRPSIFVNDGSAPTRFDTELFYFKSPARDTDGKAEIQVRCGHTGPRQAILKAGSKVSKEVSDKFGGAQAVINQRKQLENAGKLINRILQVDVPFNSQSGAGQFLNGTSFDGNSNWKTVVGNTPLKQLLS